MDQNVAEPGRQLAKREEPLTVTALDGALLRRARVPMELRPAFRVVVGRWRSCHAAAAALSHAEARELGDLTNDPMHKTPRTAWSKRTTDGSSANWCWNAGTTAARRPDDLTMSPVW